MSAASQPVLLFDLVGTLIDEATDYEALDAAMEAARYRFGIREEASSLSGDFSLALMEILRQEEGDADAAGEPADFVPFERAAKEVFAAVLEVRGIDAGEADVAWFWRTFLDVQKRVVKAHPDAKACLEWARQQGYPVWVVTDADPYFARDILPHTGLPALWDGLVTAAEAGAPKPDAPIFKLALARAGTKPVNAIMIGDSYERDVLGARAAGIPRAVLVDRHRARTVDDVPVISSLLHLPAALATVVPSVN
jgi:HAD superfamily hydrolase (TIGR01509 family)